MAAFPNTPIDDLCNRTNAGLAIAAYERTMLSNQAPFQQWLRGDMDAMSAEEKQGALLFFGKAKCNSCHTGPALNSMAFYGMGMKDLFETTEITYGAGVDSDANLGRGGFTKKAIDYYKFKVPQLYNLKDSPFYGHGSSFRTIREVIEYKNAAVAENPSVPPSQLAVEFVPLNLTDEEIGLLVTFIESGLYDPNLVRYEPEEIRSGNCFPANDPASQEDLGCN